MANDARIGTKIYGYTAQGDLLDRAMSLGYTGEAAARLADCFTNWDNVTDPCAKHPAHSTSVRDGYAVDGCEACEVIRMTDDAGWVPSVKPTVVKVVTVHLNDGAAKPPCGRGANTDSDPTKTTCRRCKGTRRYADMVETAKFQATMTARIPARAVEADQSLNGGKTPARIEVIPNRPAIKVVEPAPGLPATWTFWQMDTPEGGTQVVWVALTHEAEPSRRPDGVVVFDGTALASREHMLLPTWQAMQRTGSLRQIDAPAQPCRNNGHEYCMNGCALNAWTLAARRSARTTVETEQQCADRIKRQDYRVGDVVPFAYQTGYVLHQDRPSDCRRNFICQCGLCDGVSTSAAERVTEVISWASGGVDIRGHLGGYQTIRPDRLD